MKKTDFAFYVHQVKVMSNGTCGNRFIFIPSSGKIINVGILVNTNLAHS